MNGSHAAGNSGKRYSRDQFLQLLDAALQTKSYRFGRQAALAWLAVYPGDLQVNLYQAKLLLGEGKSNQALPMLDRLVRLDPEFGEAYKAMAQATFGDDPKRYDHAVTSLVALREGRPNGPAVKEWGPALREAHHLVERGMAREAEPGIKQVVERPDAPTLAAVWHVNVVSKGHDAQALYQLADHYHEHNPECLQLNLQLADALMQLGNEPEAVNLLHKCMSMDAAGQVVTRLWGKDHPYRAIWPDALSIHLDVAIPAEVAAKMGWNWMLPAESAVISLPPTAAAKDAEPEESGDEVDDQEEGDSGADEENPADSGDVPVDDGSVDEGDDSPELPCDEDTPPDEPGEDGEGDDEESQESGDETISEVESEFEKLAKRLRHPTIGRADGRFPVYLVFSSKKGLVDQYGPLTVGIIDTELHRLGDAVRRRTGWETVVYYPDDEECASSLSVKVVKERDPWTLKLALGDLDKAFAKKGLMIGMMLIVGGPEIVPFHELPNPTDDFDEKVVSDNPYATLDSNYFVPEWPLGRLPGSNNTDAGPILEQIRYLVAYHNRRSKAKFSDGFFAPLFGWLEGLGRALSMKKDLPNTGYTAAVWRKASVAVFRPVGNPSQVLVCPPQVSGDLDVEKLLAPELSYFNLHGLVDGGEWYGQRDPSESKTGVEYPVALSPKELHRNGHSPRIIFSEACYGGLIDHKCEESAMSLKFLSLGTLAVVGSTCISYGSIQTPLIAADLLGNYFWQQVRIGRPVGKALMIAKIELVREMIKRQGYLDAEDQKTLLSFVLYGDPLVCLDTTVKLPKNQIRFKRVGTVKTIKERPVQEEVEMTVTEEVLDQVKQAVAGCLPGLNAAEVSVREEVGAAAKNGKNGRSGKNPRSRNSSQGRYVVTLAKSIPYAKSLHRHYVRATVENGKLLKLAVSR